MTRIHTLLVSAAATCLCMTAVSADPLYKWVDDQGHTHYSQTPPPSAGTKAKAVNIEVARADATAAAAAAAGIQQAKDQQAKTNQAAQDSDADIAREAAIREKMEADQEPAREKAAKQQACNNLQAQLQTLQHADDNLTQRQQGARTFQDNADRQKQIDGLKARINQRC